MASRARSRQQSRRDIPVTVVLFCWVAFAAGMLFLFYFVDWTSVGREFAGKQQSKQSQQPLRVGSKADGDRIYTGSIVVPEARDRCWQFGFDNRNGTMWDIGYVDCFESTSQFMLGEKAGGAGGERLLAIKKSLHRGN